MQPWIDWFTHLIEWNSEKSLLERGKSKQMKQKKTNLTLKK